MKYPRRVLATALLISVAACSGQLPALQPRPIIVYSGERVQTNPERMAEVESWLTPQLERISLDPDFLIRLSAVAESGYPWDTIEITADTVDLDLATTGADAESVYLVYGYLRLLGEWGSLDEVVPAAAGQSEYGVERAILMRVADVWLLGRSVFSTAPYAPLDELVYAHEFGYLDEFIFATQADRFVDSAAAHRAEQPGSEAEFRTWFRQTFEADGPRFVRPTGDRSEPSRQDAARGSPF